MTYSHESFSELQRFWREYAQEKGTATAGTSRKEDERWGGRVQLLDWNTKTVIAAKPIPLATGSNQIADKLVVCSYRTLDFRRLDLSESHTLRHRLFCNLHSVSHHPGGLLVTSSGIDAILLVDPAANVSVFWSAIADGYNRRLDGTTRSLNLDADHADMYYPTTAQTTHVNGAIYWPSRGTVLATLFHQGELVEIDGDGHSTVVLGGLANPHSPRIRPDGVIYLTDTYNGRIAEYYSQTGKVQFVDVPGDCQWLQSVHWIDEKKAYLVTDSTNRRVVLVTPEGDALDSWTCSEDWRMHEARPILPDWSQE